MSAKFWREASEQAPLVGVGVGVGVGVTATVPLPDDPSLPPQALSSRARMLTDAAIDRERAGRAVGVLRMAPSDNRISLHTH